MEARFLDCADCGTVFEFSAEEQQHFQARGFLPPKRCRACRANKRKRRPAGGDAPAPAAAPPPRPPQQMHSATCTICGTVAEVPFVPDGVRPVYCLPCLKQRTR